MQVYNSQLDQDSTYAQHGDTKQHPWFIYISPELQLTAVFMDQ